MKVPKVLGEKALNLVKAIYLLDGDLRVQRAGEYIHIPLIDKPSQTAIEKFKKNLPEFEIGKYSFPQHKKRQLKLFEVLEGKLPPHLLASLPQAIDFVGDIAVVDVPPELENYEKVVGEAIMVTNKQVNTVLAKAGAVNGVYRVRKFKAIAGLEKTKTTYKEHGCLYHMDLAKVYFSPRLSYEHDRVASQVKNGETVIDMFAGVGPFSILSAKRLKNVKVYAIDLNPEAIHYLKKNVMVNSVVSRVMPILGDARKVIKEELIRVADRVIMNLPEKAIEYIDAACAAIKPCGGVLHYYEFTDESKPLEAAKKRFIKAVKRADSKVKKILCTRIVRAIAPFTWQVVVDAEVC